MRQYCGVVHIGLQGQGSHDTTVDARARMNYGGVLLQALPGCDNKPRLGGVVRWQNALRPFQDG